ncbi:hypothetical protein [Staphylococcus epidermidis]
MDGDIKLLLFVTIYKLPEILKQTRKLLIVLAELLIQQQEKK